MSHMFLLVGLWSLLFGYMVLRFSPRLFGHVRKQLPKAVKHRVPAAEGAFGRISALQVLLFRGIGTVGMAGGILLLVVYVLWLFGFDVLAYVL